jgi:hypothetical protein
MAAKNKKHMEEAPMFMEAIEEALELEEAPVVEAPEEAPVVEAPEEEEFEEVPEEDLEEDIKKAEELFIVIFGTEFDPDSENHVMLMAQITEKMADPEYEGLDPNQFALKMFREME